MLIFIEQVFIEYLLCIRYCSRSSRYIKEQNRIANFMEFII